MQLFSSNEHSNEMLTNPIKFHPATPLRTTTTTQDTHLGNRESDTKCSGQKRR